MKKLNLLIIIWLIGISYVRTQDWSIVSEPDISVTLNDIFFVSEDEGWVTGDEGTVLHTIDGGTTWELQNSNVTKDLATIFFYDEMNLSFIPLLDEGSTVSTAYSSFSVLPTTFFIDPDGIVSAIHRGPLTMGQIEGYLDNMALDMS